MKKLRYYYQILKHCLRFRYLVDKSRDKTEQRQIPKVIHYCWFGRNPESELVQKCIESWRQILPDYELKLWNEDNFPIEQYPFARQAYQLKKWAFVADVARLHALYHEGGIYLDSDIEMLTTLDPFLRHEALSGYQSPKVLQSGVVGAKAKSEWIHLLLSWYEYVQWGDVHPKTANTAIMSLLTRWYYGGKLKNGAELHLDSCGLHVYPADYFCPYKGEPTERSVCIHHMMASW